MAQRRGGSQEGGEPGRRGGGRDILFMNKKKFRLRRGLLVFKDHNLKIFACGGHFPYEILNYFYHIQLFPIIAC